MTQALYEIKTSSRYGFARRGGVPVFIALGDADLSAVAPEGAPLYLAALVDPVSAASAMLAEAGVTAQHTSPELLRETYRIAEAQLDATQTSRQMSTAEEIVRRCRWIEADLLGLADRHPESAAVLCVIGRAGMLLAKIADLATSHL